MFPFLVAFLAFYWFFNFEYKTQIYQSRQNETDNVETLYLSRLSIDMSSTIDVRIKEEGADFERRQHSLIADFTPSTSNLANCKRKYQSMHNVFLDPVQE